MGRSESILQTPETGKPADQAEGKTIDSLSDLVNLINEQAQHGNPQQSPAAPAAPRKWPSLCA